MNAPRAVALINRCEALGLLERRPGRVDLRTVEVHLLPAGERLLARVARQHQGERQVLMREFAPKL